MRFALVLVLALVLVNVVVGRRRKRENGPQRRCWSGSDNSRARWWPEGSRIDRGRYWYVCSNGKLDPRGCFTSSNSGKRRLSLYGKYVENGYEMSCVMDRDRKLTFRYTACVAKDGQRVMPDYEWTDRIGHVFWKCKRVGQNRRDELIRAEVMGCLKNGRKVKLDAVVEDRDFWYTCQKKWNGSVQMCPTGCIYNGRRYKIGDSWTEPDNFVYYCKLDGDECKKVCIGCTYQNQRLSTGDRYFRDNVIYQCDITDQVNEVRVIGCLRKSGVQRVLGCRWTEVDLSRRHQYEVQCVPLEVNGKKSAKPDLVACNYMRGDTPLLAVKPNTYTIWWNGQKEEGVACKEVGDELMLTTFDPKDVRQQAPGLSFRPPNTR